MVYVGERKLWVFFLPINQSPKFLSALRDKSSGIFFIYFYCCRTVLNLNICKIFLRYQSSGPVVLTSLSPTSALWVGYWSERGAQWDSVLNILARGWGLRRLWLLELQKPGGFPICLQQDHISISFPWGDTVDQVSYNWIWISFLQG